MKTLAKIMFLAAGLTGSSATAFAQIAAQAAGHWEGTIPMESLDLGIAIDLAKNPGGAWIGSMSVLGSSTRDVPLGDLAVGGKSVQFTARLPGLVTFAGALSPDASILTGSAANEKGDTNFELKRQGEAKVNLPPPSSRLAKEFAGTWEATLGAEGKTQRIGLKLSAGPDGIAVATLIALDQGNLEIPITTVTMEDKQLRLEARAISGTYRGALDGNGEIAGEWSEGGKQRALVFKPDPPEPRKP